MLWTSLFVLYIFFSKKFRKKAINVLRAFFSKELLKPMNFIVLYSLFIYILLIRFSLQNYIDYKEAILWIIFSAVPLSYEMITQELNKNYFMQIIKDNLQAIVIVEFLIGEYPFSLLTELLLVPIISFLFLLEFFAGTRNNYQDVSKFLSSILIIPGFFILFRSIILSLTDWDNFFSFNTFITFSTPVLLFYIYIPLYILIGVWFKYDNQWFRIKNFIYFKLKIFNKPKYKYIIQDNDDTSTGVSKRASIKLILEKEYNLNEIKRTCNELFAKYSYKNDVVYIYVATNAENYIMSNWIIIAHWINPKLADKSKPNIIGNNKNSDIHYEYKENYSKIEKYNEVHIFEEDEILLSKNLKLYKSVFHISSAMEHSFKQNDFDKVIYLSEKYKDDIEDMSRKLGDLGVSKDIELNHYLQLFSSYVNLLDNLVNFSTDLERTRKNKEHLIATYINDIIKIIHEIENKKCFWINKLNIKI